MSVIFPLSVPGKIVLFLVAIVLGLIWSMMVWPDAWRKMLKNDDFLRKKPVESAREPEPVDSQEPPSSPPVV